MIKFFMKLKNFMNFNELKNTIKYGDLYSSTGYGASSYLFLKMIDETKTSFKYEGIKFDYRGGGEILCI